MPVPSFWLYNGTKLLNIKLNCKVIEMKDLLNSGQILDRSEMKKIMAGSGLCTCTYGDCGVAFAQFENEWHMSISCGGGESTWSGWGSGQYGGTVCGGQCPTQPY